MDVLKAFVAAALAAAGIAAAPFPAAAQTGAKPSFDCAKARTFVERTICADAGLAAKDVKLNELYRTRFNGAKGYGMPEQAEGLKQSQRAWLAQRNRCTTAECVHASYDERLRQLSF